MKIKTVTVTDIKNSAITSIFLRKQVAPLYPYIYPSNYGTQNLVPCKDILEAPYTKWGRNLSLTFLLYVFSLYYVLCWSALKNYIYIYTYI